MDRLQIAPSLHQRSRRSGGPLHAPLRHPRDVRPLLPAVHVQSVDGPTRRPPASPSPLPVPSASTNGLCFGATRAWSAPRLRASLHLARVPSSSPPSNLWDRVDAPHGSQEGLQVTSRSQMRRSSAPGGRFDARNRDGNGARPSAPAPPDSGPSRPLEPRSLRRWKGFDSGPRSIDGGAFRGTRGPPGGEMGGHGPRGKISIKWNEISRIDRSHFGRKVSMRRGLDLHRYLFGKRSIDASADRLPRNRYLGEGGIDGRGLASARARSATNQGGTTRFLRHGHAPSRRRGVVPGDHAHVRRGSSRGGAPGEDRCAERKGEGAGSRR